MPSFVVVRHLQSLPEDLHRRSHRSHTQRMPYALDTLSHLHSTLQHHLPVHGPLCTPRRSQIRLRTLVLPLPRIRRDMPLQRAPTLLNLRNTRRPCLRHARSGLCRPASEPGAIRHPWRTSSCIFRSVFHCLSAFPLGVYEDIAWSMPQQSYRSFRLRC